MTMQTKNEAAMTKDPDARGARRVARSRRRLALLALALLGGASGCGVASDPSAAGDTVGALAALAPTTGTALDEASWRALPAGCEDVLDDVGASADDALVVAAVEGEPALCAVFVDGTARCVDAVPAVSDALRHRARAAAVLAAGWHAFEQPATPTGATTFQRSDASAGDPSPQPSAPPAPSTDALSAQPAAGDPSPQPSDRTTPTAGDPSPQPSQPVREPSTPWSPSKTEP